MHHVLVPMSLFVCLFVAAPWILFHYVTQWKKNGGLSIQDENLLDELHDLARRLDDRLATIERIVAADDPGFRRPVSGRLADEREGDPGFDRLAERRAPYPTGRR